MTLRQDLFDLARHFGLNSAQGTALHTAAGMDVQPAAANRLAVPSLTLLAAMLAGFGLILWIAANWGLWSRSTHFALLGGLLLASSAGAWVLAPRRGAGVALGLVALATLGGLLAYFGQTYQTGADPWQLFALWTGLALPLCLGLRSRVLWMPWSLIANTAISLWAWAQLERWVQSDAAGNALLQPDLTLWFDLPAAVAAQRRAAARAADRLEQEDLAFFDRVRAGYARRAAADPQRIVRIDADQPREAVWAAVARAVPGLQLAGQGD